MLFSQRKGIKPISKIIQADVIDDDLRNGLWSSLQLFYWDTFTYYASKYRQYIKGSNLQILFHQYWHSYFKQPIDTVPSEFSDALSIAREYFFECQWYEVYDFIEFTAINGPGEAREDFKKFCNSLLERENSAYRFVGDHITEITSPEEIQSVEEAMEATSVLSGVKAHLEAALDHLSDRKSPDYRNSIKESISAVEAICQQISRDRNATLGKALSVLEKKNAIHGALKKSFAALYGYTSDADGIRHAMLEESDITFIDAKFMLVACTSFINYILGKTAELGINIEKSP